MTNEKLLRQYIVKLLKTDGAHADFAAAVKDMPLDLRGKKTERRRAFTMGSARTSTHHTG